MIQKVHYKVKVTEILGQYVNSSLVVIFPLYSVIFPFVNSKSFGKLDKSSAVLSDT